MPSPLKLFVSYSHNDAQYKDQLLKHLAGLTAEGVLEAWVDDEIRPGEEWDEEIKASLDAADVVVCLVSADFVASSYCYGKELDAALTRKSEGKAQLVPVLIRDVDLQSVAKLQKREFVPKKDGHLVAVEMWPQADTAWTQVAMKIREFTEASSAGQGDTPAQGTKSPDEAAPATNRRTNSGAVPRTPLRVPAWLPWLAAGVCVCAGALFFSFRDKDGAALAYESFAWREATPEEERQVHNSVGNPSMRFGDTPHSQRIYVKKVVIRSRTRAALGSKLTWRLFLKLSLERSPVRIDWAQAVPAGGILDSTAPLDDAKNGYVFTLSDIPEEFQLLVYAWIYDPTGQADLERPAQWLTLDDPVAAR